MAIFVGVFKRERKRNTNCLWWQTASNFGPTFVCLLTLVTVFNCSYWTRVVSSFHNNNNKGGNTIARSPPRLCTLELTTRIIAGSKLLFQLCHFFVPRFCFAAGCAMLNVGAQLEGVILQYHIFFANSARHLDFSCRATYLSNCPAEFGQFVFFLRFFFVLLLLTQQNCVRAT